MKASRHVRAGGALGHLLLVAVLTLGIFTMHTLGHPDTSHGSAATTVSHATATDVAHAAGTHASHALTTDAAHTTAMDVSHATAMGASHAPMGAPVDTESGMGSHSTELANPSSAHQPAVGGGMSPDMGAGPDVDMGMDMLSLCLAVLFGAWALAALLRSAFARREDWLAKLLAQVAAVLRPNPPPRGPDLTLLSVLRL